VVCHMFAADSPQVLIVEDDQSFRRLLQELLQSERIPALIATDGVSALQAINKSRADNEELRVILLDIALPRFSGLDVLTYLHNMGISIPVIAMSADREALARAVVGGAHAALAKPFEIGELLCMLTELCSRHGGQPDASGT